MIDAAMGHYARYHFTADQDDYTAAQAIRSKELVNPSGRHLTVLFPPWRGGEGAYDVLTRRLQRNGSAVLRYNLHPQILEPNADRVLASFAGIRDGVAEAVAKLQSSDRYAGTHLVAASLGGVSLGLVARQLADFTSATLVVPGSDLATGMWAGSRTRHIRQELERQGLNKEQLAARWADLAPAQAAPSFAGKEVRIITSTTDTIIPAWSQVEMVAAVRSYAPNTQVDTTRMGHIVSVARFCIAGPLPNLAA